MTGEKQLFQFVGVRTWIAAGFQTEMGQLVTDYAVLAMTTHLVAPAT